MSFDFSTLVTDRTQADVNRVKQISEKIKNGTASESELAEFNSAAMKGAYNYTDLNRVTAAMEALKAKLEGYGYAVPGYQRIKVPHVLPEPDPTSKLPEGYTQVEYIQSSGTQYIDTGVVANQNIGFELDFETANSVSTTGFATVFGCLSTTSTRYEITTWTNNAFGGEFCFGANTYDPAITSNTRMFLSLRNGTFTTPKGSTAVATTAFNSGISIELFGRKRQGVGFDELSKTKIFSCRFYDGNTIIRDYIPCINPNGEVGLYDLVTAAFFGNSGTGSFVAGAIPRKLPDGYTQVEYIQSTGTQYIDTGFKPNHDTRVVFDFQLLATSSNYRSVLGVRDTASDTSPRQFVFWNYPSDIFRTDYFGTNVTISGLTRLARMVLDKNKNVTTAQGLTTTNTAATGQCTQNLFLLCVNEAGTAKYFTDARIYACQIYDNGVLVRDYVPCINPIGVVGLYDMVDGVFYQNAGTGSFAAGEEVVAPATASAMVVSDDVDEYDSYTWYEFDWPTTETMIVYLLNVSAIRAVLAVLRSTPEVPTDIERMMTRDANDIEAILLDVYRQLTIMPTTFIPCGEALCGGYNL